MIKTTWTFDYKSKLTKDIIRYPAEFEKYDDFLYTVRKFKSTENCDIRLIIKSVHESIFKWNEEL